MSLIDKYALAFDISPVPLVLVSEAGEILLANAGFLALFEYESDELIGQNVEILVPQSIHAHHTQFRASYHHAPTKRSMGTGRDLHGVTKSGTVIPLELGLEPVIDGQTKLAMVAAIDIRSRKIHEQRVHQAMDAAASAMVMVEGNGQIVFINNAASNLFGYDKSELLDHPIDMLVPEDVRPVHHGYMESFNNNQSIRSMGLGRDLFARHRDGSLIPVEIVLTPVASSEGNLVMSTIIDLTERVAAQKDAAEKNAELAALNSELSQFVYSASHDLKAPLSSITGLLQLCIEDLKEGDVTELRENLDRAVQISDRSALKVEGVLKIARVGSDDLPCEFVALEELIQEIWLDLTGGHAIAQLRLELHHDDPIFAERLTLSVILENLLSNARRYGDPKKAEHIITIKSSTTEHGLRVSVADNGIGVAPQNVPKVFQMFKKLDGRSEDGLGMSLVKKQIDRLGGTITLKSRVGEGSEFVFVLPLTGDVSEQNTSGDRR